jgi:hypothetical protein
MCNGCPEWVTTVTAQPFYIDAMMTLTFSSHVVHYGQVGYREQAFGYLFGSGYCVFLPFGGVLADVIWSIQLYSEKTVLF